MTDEIMRFIVRLFEKHARKMRNIVSRGEVSMVQDGPKMQTNQIKLLDGELIDGAERAQQYGFTSHPQNGAECFVVFAGADRAHPIILSVDDRRYRVKSSKPGEVVIYTDEGDQIALKRDNTIEVTTKHFIVKAEEDVLIETKAFTLTAEISITSESPQTAVKTDNLTMTNKEGGETEATMQGSLTASNDVKANDGAVSLRGHVHDGIQRGDDDTNKPVGG